MWYRRSKFYMSGLSVILLLILFGCFFSSDTALEKKAARIHQQVLTVDTHCDTPLDMVREGFDIGIRHEPHVRRGNQIDFPRMAEGGLDASFFAVYVGQGERTPEAHKRIKKRADMLIDTVKAACERYPQMAEMAFSPEDAYRIEKGGKRAIFMGMENGYPIGTDLSLVSYFYNRGIRYITLCHNGNNEICDSSTDEPEWNGLSPFGIDVVREMNRLGMIIDVSHISDSSFYDVIRFSKAPVMASHSCCRSLCGHERNLTDDMMIKLAENGGVLQICFVSPFVKELESDPRREAAIDSLVHQFGGSYWTLTDSVKKADFLEAYYKINDKHPRPRATLKDLVDHIDYAVNLIGIDHVGIGTDFDGGGGIEGCSDATELPNVTLELVHRGYAEDQIRKIWGGNFMRVFREIRRVAQEIQNGAQEINDT